ncbi:zinc ABC transporter substrate-binding protein [Candidatus Bathyarchaeota archaeon]|nr:MAG: zinc ABC transporter substrate-binding protein [Candidatus Bathyarchaeota archaeon]
MIGVFLVGAFPSLSLTSQNTDNKILVAVTILPEAEFVEKVGGERVKVVVMIPPGASPHTYEPTPKQLVEVSKAKIYFKVGSGVDFELSFMNKIIEVNRNIKVVDCSEGIQVLDKDPHIWLSPRNARIMVKNIYDALVQIDPENKDYYYQNMKSYIQELDNLDKEITRILANVTNRCFMIYHPAWGYFARDYNLTQIPVEKEGKKPTIQGLMALIDQARKLKMKVIFVSPQFDVKKAETIAESIHGKTVFLDPLAKDYVKNLRSAALELARSMTQNE